MKLFMGFGLCSLLLSSALVSSAIIADEAISTTKFNSIENDWPVKSVLKTGFGTFNDIQLPKGLDEETRLDGITAEPESQTQVGVLLGGDFTILSPMESVQWITKIQALRLVNLTFTLDNADSGFSLVGAETGLRLNSMAKWMIVDLALGYQTNFYSNISTGHNLSFIYPKVSTLFKLSRNSTVSTFASFALKPTFAYDRGDKDVALKQTEASSFAFGGEYQYNLNQTSAITLGVHMDRSEVNLKNIETYEDAGFSVISFDSPAKRLQLSTVITSFGLSTVW